MQNETVISGGVWHQAFKRLVADRLAMACLVIVLFFLAMVAASYTGIVASDWEEEIAVHYAPPHFVGADEPETQQDIEEKGSFEGDVEVPANNPVDPLKNILGKLRKQVRQEKLDQKINMYGIKDPLQKDLQIAREQVAQAGGEEQAVSVRASTLLFGADKWGHDVIKKTIKGSETSILVGLASALIATTLGTLLGAISGYCGGYIDDFLNWFYNVFTSIPYLLLILAVAAVLQTKGLTTIIMILGLTGWTGIFRLVRAEYIRHKQREYVLAARTIGAGHLRRMFIHIFPNVSHISLVQFSLLAVGFIKSEVILSFLGFGVPVGVVSWGSMLNEAQNELILGKWWQMVAVTVAMAILVSALSLFTDGLRDAIDPKLRQGRQ